MIFSKNLKFLRLKEGLTLREMGDIVGVSHESIANYEKGEVSRLKKEKIEKITTHFGVSEYELLNIEISLNNFDKSSFLTLNEPIVEYQKPQKISFDPMQMDRIEAMLGEVLRLLKEK